MSEHPWGLIRTGHVWLQAVVFEVKRESPMLTSGTLKTPGGRAEEWTTLVVGGGGGVVRGRVEGLRMLWKVLRKGWVQFGGVMSNMVLDSF